MNLQLIKQWISHWEGRRPVAYDDATGRPIRGHHTKRQKSYAKHVGMRGQGPFIRDSDIPGQLTERRSPLLSHSDLQLKLKERIGLLTSAENINRLPHTSEEARITTG